MLIPVSSTLASHVARVKFFYGALQGGAENGYVGVSEFVISGKPSADTPVMVQDVSPLTAADVVGSKLTLTASFNSYSAMTYQWQKDGVDIPGVTSSTLTLVNLQLSDTATNGGYRLVVSNASGNAVSGGCSVTVNPVPSAVANVVTAVAYQTAFTENFMPTWDTAELSSSLIYQVNPPTSTGPGNFKDPDVSPARFNRAGGLPVLTDGSYGNFTADDSHPAFATCGGNAGRSVTYAFDTTPAGSPNGYNLSKIQIAGGWNDSGRDAQFYTVYYSTVLNPTTFKALAYSSNNPVLANPSNRSVTRTTFTPASGILASNVAAVYIDFTAPGNENGYCGYSEISVFGSGSPLPPPTGIMVTTENQNTDAPSWNIEQDNLIAGRLPVGYGGNFTVEAGGGSLPVLTDGAFGTSGIANFVTCGSTDASFVIYTCTNRSWSVSNIVVYSGWGNYDRDGQFYDISYSTPEDPTKWIPLASVDYDPTVAPTGASSCRVVIAKSDGGVLAANVGQIKFDFARQNGRDNGYSGYSEIVLRGSIVPGSTILPVVTVENQQSTLTWSVESGNLVAGQLPSNVVGGANGFTGEGCNVTNLTDGVLGFGYQFGASCGSEVSLVNSFTFNSAGGWNLTNIVVHTGWWNFGRDGQFYNIYYSTLSAPNTFLPLVNVEYNPSVSSSSANRVSITPAVGQTMLASNVAAVKFDFTPQGTRDYSWSGYSEIVLLGASLTPETPDAPIVNPPYSSEGNLILTGTGGTPNSGYTWLTTTNVALPLTEWTISTTGVLDNAGAFSNSIPVNASQPVRFFKLQMQ